MNYDEFMNTKFGCESSVHCGSAIITKLWPQFKEHLETEDDIAEAAIMTAQDFYVYYIKEFAMPDITIDQIKCLYRQYYSSGYVFNCNNFQEVKKVITENVTCYQIKGSVPSEVIADMLLQEAKRIIKEQTL
jgi:hypothetical protein